MNKKVESALSKIVVIGGSQGAIEALLQIMPQLPAELPAAIFVVVHLPSESDSVLPGILGRASGMQVQHAKDGEAIEAGTVYVAPPDYHLTLEGGTIHVRRGPRENRHRPAIDPLFRTAARAFGSEVIAVVLSGNLDDGSGGMFAVRTRGGVGIVQDPSDAQAGEMPRRALDYAGADYVLPVKEIAPKLIELINSRKGAMKVSKKTKKSAKTKASNGADREIRVNEEVSDPDQGNGKPSVFACPECHGVLWEVKEGRLGRFRCRVGHGYTAASLKEEMDQSGERALWAAMRALEEKAAMSRRMIGNMKGPRNYTQRLREQIEDDINNAQTIRKMIFASDQ